MPEKRRRARLWRRRPRSERPARRAKRGRRRGGPPARAGRRPAASPRRRGPHRPGSPGRGTRCAARAGDGVPPVSYPAPADSPCPRPPTRPSAWPPPTGRPGRAATPARGTAPAAFGTPRSPGTAPAVPPGRRSPARGSRPASAAAAARAPLVVDRHHRVPCAGLDGAAQVQGDDGHHDGGARTSGQQGELVRRLPDARGVGHDRPPPRTGGPLPPCRRAPCAGMVPLAGPAQASGGRFQRFI